MLFSLGHGQRIVADVGGPEGMVEGGAKKAAKAGTKYLSDVAPGTPAAPGGLEAGVASDVKSFGYFFPDAPGDMRANVTGGIAALAAAMIEQGGDTPPDSNIPPIFTYLGQFIDHDITANTDRDAPNPNPISVVTGATLSPLDRGDVIENIMNLRKGSLGLDSLYGEGPSSSAFSEKVRLALRDPADKAKMRLGAAGPLPFGQPIPLPSDNLADLPRLGDMLADPASGLTIADIDALPAGDLKDSFKTGTEVQNWRAMIGDGRNDENLIVAQMHLAFLRFHNAVADALKASIPNADDRFAEAQKRTQWYYQWLVVNAYLPHVCDTAVVDAVKSANAPLYAAFRARVAPGSTELPLPLEFSVAAFRFGHSMVRAAYDHNRNFGRPLVPNALQGATFRQLFSFTGGNQLGQDTTGVKLNRLAGNWPIEWDRLALDPPSQSDHVARKIDTNLAVPLSVMLNQGNGVTPASDSAILKQLAERNMRRGYRLNIPTGQSAVAAINAFDGVGGGTGGGKPSGYYGYYKGGTGGTSSGGGIAVLTEAQLASGKTGAAITSGGFAAATPLWFYVLKEAEIAGGNRLGALGSRLVAETLVGLVIADPTSYWHQGAGNGSWHPSTMPLGTQVIDTMPKMLKAAGLMA